MTTERSQPGPYLEQASNGRICCLVIITFRNEANPYHVKEPLGHESLNTLRHYAKLTILDVMKTHAKRHPRERDDA